MTERALKRVSLREFNRNWGEMIAAAENGETVELTRRGRVVARLVPAGGKRLDRRRSAAHRELMAFLEKGIDAKIGRWTRDELYERDS